MKPAAFDYLRPASAAEAVSQIARCGGDAKFLAGGQSLMPLLNFRVLRPSVLIDISRLDELDYIRDDGGGLRVGALTRHRTLETSPLIAERFPVLRAAMAHVAHPAIRNRGTIGGSLSHADPAAELPLLAVLLDAEIRTSGRRFAARDFFVGALTTALADDELVTEIVFPKPVERTGWGFEEFALRRGDFAFAAVAATLSLAGGRIAAARIAAGGIGEVPLRLQAAEGGLVGQSPTPDLIAEVAAQASEIVAPMADLRASADYRRRLVAALTERALSAAARRAA